MTLAHQGGWDEFLLVVAPMVVLALVLWLANRRAGRSRPDGDADEAGQPEPPSR